MNKMFIRTDVGASIGIGHFMRSLALAQAWQKAGGQAVFIMINRLSSLNEHLKNEGMSAIYLEKTDIGSMSDAKQTVKQIGRTENSWVVLDGYSFGAEYQRAIKRSGLCLLCIDDYGHAQNYCADIILNYDLSATKLFYNKRKSYTKLLLGPHYALLRHEFWGWRRRKRTIRAVAKRVLVTFGGGDSENMTLKAIRALKQMRMPGLEAKIVIGAANQYFDVLRREIGENKPLLQIISNTHNMSELMAWADVSISAGGSTCWELAFMGLSALVVVTAKNQKKNTEKLASKGVVKNLGEHSAVTVNDISRVLKTLISDQPLRKKMSRNGRKLVDGNGAHRVVKKLLNFNNRTGRGDAKEKI